MVKQIPEIPSHVAKFAPDRVRSAGDVSSVLRTRPGVLGPFSWRYTLKRARFRFRLLADAVPAAFLPVTVKKVLQLHFLDSPSGCRLLHLPMESIPAWLELWKEPPADLLDAVCTHRTIVLRHHASCATGAAEDRHVLSGTRRAPWADLVPSSRLALLDDAAGCHPDLRPAPRTVATLATCLTNAHRARPRDKARQAALCA